MSVERNVETLVVADRKMTEFYSNEDIETYILTVMNMVQISFHLFAFFYSIRIIPIFKLNGNGFFLLFGLVFWEC